jgi:hypothetical protein
MFNKLKEVKTIIEIIKYYSKIKKEVKMQKNGYKTTEFWLTIAGIIINIYMHVKGLIPADVTVKYGSLLIAIYSLGRSIAKITPTQKDDEFFNKLEQLVKNASETNTNNK